MRPCCVPRETWTTCSRPTVSSKACTSGATGHRRSAIGYKALAVNLSDLASMGAAPRASLLSLVLPADFPLTDFDALIDGFLALAATSGACLIGGNMTRSPGPLVVDVTAIGTVHPRRVLRRSGARPGDELYVERPAGRGRGRLGDARSGCRPPRTVADALACLERFERPDARTRCGRIVGRLDAASAAMDLSDGLATPYGSSRRPAPRGSSSRPTPSPCIQARGHGRPHGMDALAFTLAGGEDYELALTVSPRRRRRFRSAAHRCPDLPMTRIGRVVGERGAWIERDGVREPIAAGFVHFPGSPAGAR